jgi:hypothetical protein
MDEMDEQIGKSVGPVVEVRSYTLTPGTRERFHALMVGQGLRLLQRWNIEVVAVGPSLHDENSYYLMRAFASLADLERSEEAFYSSEEWRQGPREAILACIERYTDVVLPANEALFAARRQG